MPTIVSAMLFSRGPISRQPNGVQIENTAVIIPVLGSISESHASMRALEYKRLARFCRLLRFFIISLPLAAGCCLNHLPYFLRHYKRSLLFEILNVPVFDCSDCRLQPLNTLHHRKHLPLMNVHPCLPSCVLVADPVG